MSSPVIRPPECRQFSFFSAKEAEISICFMLMYADFHGYGSLSDSTRTHLCNRAGWWALMSIHFPSVAGVKPIQHTPFSQWNRCRAPIKTNCLWRSACLHCNVVCKLPLPSTSLKTNTRAGESGVSDSSCCQQAVENQEVCVGAKWTQLVRSGPIWVTFGTIITAVFALRAAYLQQTAESAAFSWLACPVKPNQVQLNSHHTLHIWPPWAWSKKRIKKSRITRALG